MQRIEYQQKDKSDLHVISDNMRSASLEFLMRGIKISAEDMIGTIVFFDEDLG